MQRITLTEEQSRLLAESKENVEVYDSTGQLVSFLKWFDPATAEVIAQHIQRMNSPRQPGISSERVQAMLRRFEEIDRTEGMTREKMEEVLRRVKGGEAI
jgi:hypothetical protein